MRLLWSVGEVCPLAVDSRCPSLRSLKSQVQGKLASFAHNPVLTRIHAPHAFKTGRSYANPSSGPANCCRQCRRRLASTISAPSFLPSSSSKACAEAEQYHYYSLLRPRRGPCTCSWYSYSSGQWFCSSPRQRLPSKSPPRGE